MSDGDNPADPVVSAEPIPTENIAKAPVEVPLSGATGQEELEHAALTRAREETQFQQELGFLGRLFGGKNEKPGNISALVIVLCFLSLAVVWAVDTYIAQLGKNTPPVMPFEHIFSGLMSLIALVLGYIFGSHSKDSK
jgi:hypothetical protein